MGPYIFVIATIVAVLPILFIFKITVERVKENPNLKEKALIQFFIWVAIIETVPILLIVFGMMNLESVPRMEELYMPGIIIILTAGFAALFIFLQRTFDVEEELKEFMNTSAMICLALANAIPLISIVALFLMMP